MSAREQFAHDYDGAMTERESAVELREGALRAQAEADRARIAREQLMVQMRDANERLVLATLRADELLEQAVAARAVAAEAVTIEADGRRRAETLATQLLASEDALRASESEARSSNLAKDEFLAMLGHELRNPLAPILVALDMIAMDANDSHEREHEIIGNQVKHLVRLVDELLDVSRISTGKIVLRREPIELAVIVSRSVELAGPLIESKGHSLSIDVPARGLTIDGDPFRLTQIVSNLLHNAAKYTLAGGTIVVTGEQRGTRVALRVRDHGIGISKEMLPRIFDLFAQELQPLDRGPGGLGLGLAIVRSLVTLHDGTVTAHSDGLGCGSEFVIELPALKRAEAAPPIVRAIHGVAPVAARKVLVVDDNRLVAELTGRGLTRLGHEVRIAFDGVTALSLVEDFVPDVVLLDVGLPGMDGYEVARRLRTVLAQHALYLVAITGYGRPADRLRSADAGFDEHLVKPVDLAMIQHSIDNAPSM